MAKTDSNETNPCGLNGVDFLEYTGNSDSFYSQLFTAYGFKCVSHNKEHHWKLYKQNDINFFVTEEEETFAESFSKLHGPSICSMGLRVVNAEQAFATAVKRGARPFTGSAKQRGPFKNIPAIFGIGDSLVYFIDPQISKTLYHETMPIDISAGSIDGFGFTVMDHFTNNVPVGQMNKWCEFYERIFNFRETRYFDIRGKQTGLISKVMRSPCNKFSIPINEPTDGKSQIQEYLDQYNGSGIQHVALLTPNIIKTFDNLKANKLEFLSAPPDTYYKQMKERLPNVSEDVEVLKKNGLLADGDDQGYLLQVFSKNIIGPIFFEVIQRKNHFGFGEGNFQALFDAIEADQKERGFLK